jgi:mRNA-degrading endonuclease RelE of RelBE toxin-antitoxin system
MPIEFHGTDTFEEELQKLQPKERAVVISKVNQYCATLDVDPTQFRRHAYRPLKIMLPDDVGSSLYALRVSPDLRVILTVEDDPLFGRTLVTLLRVVRHSALDKVFRGVVEGLYQGRARVEGDGRHG